MNELKLVKSEFFGDVEADIYSNGKEMFMTIGQLGNCLAYANGRKGIENLLERNSYLKDEEFSVTLKLRATDGKKYDTRVFTEDGIYEVTMLSSQPIAKEFRAWIRGILKALRSGKAKIVGMTEYQQMVAQTRAENIRVRKAQILERLANQYDGTYHQVLHAYATKELTGEFLLPLPRIEARTYTAEEIGNRVGISKQMVGILSNRHNLKTDQYGAWYNDKVKGSNKEVPCFRYYDTVIPALQKILADNKTA